MQIDIYAQGFSLSGALRDCTERRLRVALARVADRVPQRMGRPSGSK